MDLNQAQRNALKDDELASATFTVMRGMPYLADARSTGSTLTSFGTARLIAYLLKRVTQAEDLIQAIVEAEANEGNINGQEIRR